MASAQNHSAEESVPAAEADPRRRALALGKGDARRGPKVVAKGYGVAADAILQRARQNGVYVHESMDLMNLLMKVDLDEHIPPELYLAVSELLVWLYELDARGSELERRFSRDEDEQRAND